MIAQKMSYRIRLAWYRNLFALGLGGNLHRNRPGRRLIIYHGIDEAGSTNYNARFISKDYLEKQLIYFKENFHVVNLEDYLAGASHPEKLTVSLTFDDGYRNNFKYVLPLLEKHEIPASFFITTVRAAGREALWPDMVDLKSHLTDHPVEIDKEEFTKNAKGEYTSNEGTLKQRCINEGVVYSLKAEQVFPMSTELENHPELDDYWQLMSEDEIKTMAESPWVTLGTHGLLHCSYTHIDRWFAYEEMKDSKRWLESITSNEIKAIAFPFGHYTRDNVNDAEELGYAHQLAVDYLHSEDSKDKRLADRFGINPYIDWNLQLAFLLRGRY